MPCTNKLVIDKAGIVNAFHYPNEVFLALLHMRNLNSFQALSTSVVGHYLLGINCGFGVASTSRNLLSSTALTGQVFLFYVTQIHLEMHFLFSLAFMLVLSHSYSCENILVTKTDICSYGIVV